jgi:hypothetical protein
MIELKNKKTGKSYIVSDDEYAGMVNEDKNREQKLLPRFTVTNLKVRSVIPREAPKDIKKKKE